MLTAFQQGLVQAHYQRTLSTLTPDEAEYLQRNSPFLIVGGWVRDVVAKVCTGCTLEPKDLDVVYRGDEALQVPATGASYGSFTSAKVGPLDCWRDTGPIEDLFDAFPIDCQKVGFDPVTGEVFGPGLGDCLARRIHIPYERQPSTGLTAKVIKLLAAGWHATPRTTLAVLRHAPWNVKDAYRQAMDAMTDPVGEARYVAQRTAKLAVVQMVKNYGPPSSTPTTATINTAFANFTHGVHAAFNVNDTVLTSLNAVL